MAREMKVPGSFARVGGRYKEEPTILVICEDSKSGKRYLEDAARNYRVHISVKIAHCGNTDPKGIVVEAMRLCKKFDTVFCAIDRDTHENYDEALLLAKRVDKIKVISSNPCLEYWYFLHFAYSRKSYAIVGGKSPGDQMVSDLKIHLRDYDKASKSNLFEKLLPNLDEAKQRAKRGLLQAEDEQSMNPSTQMHELIEFFDKLSNPQFK